MRKGTSVVSPSPPPPPLTAAVAALASRETATETDVEAVVENNEVRSRIRHQQGRGDEEGQQQQQQQQEEEVGSMVLPQSEETNTTPTILEEGRVPQHDDDAVGGGSSMPDRQQQQEQLQSQQEQQQQQQQQLHDDNNTPVVVGLEAQVVVDAVHVVTIDEEEESVGFSEQQQQQQRQQSASPTTAACSVERSPPPRPALVAEETSAQGTVRREISSRSTAAGGVADDTGNNKKKKGQSPSSSCRVRLRNNRKAVMIGVTLVLLVVVAIVVTSVVLCRQQQRQQEEEDRQDQQTSSNSNSGTSFGASPSPPPPTPTTSTTTASASTVEEYGYECFKSTEQLRVKQVEDYIFARDSNSTDNATTATTTTPTTTTTTTVNNRNNSNKVYIMCPNTTIKIGVLENPARGLFGFKNGDVPLWVVTPNTVIQCGIDGRVENNCTLKDGFFHVLLMTSIAGLDGYRFGTGRDESIALEDANLRLDNVTIKGMTFSGIVGSDGTFGGSSVGMSQSGNVTFDGCSWTDIVSAGGLIMVMMNQYQISLGKFVPPNSAQLNIVRSTFTNIKYDGPILFNWYQSIHVSDCTFSNFSLIQSPDPRCYHQEAISYKALEDGSSELDDSQTLVMSNGCAMIMMCLSRTSCSMTNTSLCSMELNSDSMVYIHRPDVSDYYFLNNIVDDRSRSQVECELISGVVEVPNMNNQQQPSVVDGVPSSPSSSSTAVSASSTCIEDQEGGSQIFDILRSGVDRSQCP